MVSYKLDIIQKYGKLQKRIYKTAERPKDYDPKVAYKTIHDVLGARVEDLKGISFDEDEDTITFRGVAYDDMYALKVTIRDSQY